MPRYEANPANDQAVGLTIVPNGDYELKVKRVASFERTNQDGKASYGVRLTVQACEGEFAGKTLSPITLYYHSDGGRGYSKTQLIAIAGFTSEADFNDWARDLDFGFDTESKSVNDGWNQLVGKRFIAEVKLGVDNNDKPRNEYGQLRAL
jgi:hypothetical protein